MHENEICSQTRGFYRNLKKIDKRKTVYIYIFIEKLYNNFKTYQ